MQFGGLPTNPSGHMQPGSVEPNRHISQFGGVPVCPSGHSQSGIFPTWPFGHGHPSCVGFAVQSMHSGSVESVGHGSQSGGTPMLPCGHGQFGS